MKRYQTIVRVVFGLIFVAGGVSHLFLGQLQPDGYAAFAQTALFPWLADLWMSFVMPNIGWLTIALGIYEIACGVGMSRRRLVRLAAAGMVVFLVFITIVGYGFPTESHGEDLLKNRLITIVMAAALFPLLRAPRRGGNP